MTKASKGLCATITPSDKPAESVSTASAQRKEKFRLIELSTAAVANALECFYNRQRRSRNALPITIKSEKPIAAAHNTGLINPSAASGTPTAL